MRRFPTFSKLLACCFLWGSVSSSLVFAEDSWTPQGNVSPSGVGPMHFGMTVKEASRALNVPLIEEKSERKDDGVCSRFLPNGFLQPMYFTFADAKVVRLDVIAPGVKTESGIQVGTSVDWVLKRWGPRVSRQPHPKLKNGETLLLKPLGRFDEKYRVAFETDGKKVIAFRAGLLPFMQSPSACKHTASDMPDEKERVQEEVYIESKPLGSLESPKDLRNSPTNR